MARLGRTIYTTRCVGVGFDKNNEPFNVDFEMLGKVTSLEQANSRARKKLKNNKILINEFETTSKYYSMTIEEFLKNASLITDHE